MMCHYNKCFEYGLHNRKNRRNLPGATRGGTQHPGGYLWKNLRAGVTPAITAGLSGDEWQFPRVDWFATPDPQPHVTAAGIPDTTSRLLPRLGIQHGLPTL